jgi:hypothetical protein
MKKITLEQLNKIEAINGTLSERYEYIDAIATVLEANLGGVRWNVNTMKTISLDKDHILDINTKKIKGQRFIIGLTVYNSKGIPTLWLERKRNVWICKYDSDWFAEGNWKEGAERLKDQPYVG